MKILQFVISILVIGFSVQTGLMAQGKKGEYVAPKEPTEAKDIWVYKLRTTTIEKIKFEETPVLEAVEFVAGKCPAVTIFGRERFAKTQLKVDWETKNVDCAEALLDILDLADCRLKTDSRGIHIIPKPTMKETFQRMMEITLPSVEFVDTPLNEALRFLQQRSAELNPYWEIDGAKPREKGTSFILEVKPKPRISGEIDTFKGAKVVPPPTPGGFDELSGGFGTGGGIGDARITLQLRNVPLYEAVRYTCALAQMVPIFENGTLLIVPMDRPGAKAKFEAQWKIYEDFRETKQEANVGKKLKKK